MFWPLLLILLSPLSALCLRLLRDHRDREILALRQEVLPPLATLASWLIRAIQRSRGVAPKPHVS